HYRAHTDLIDKDEYTARALYKSALSEFHLGRYREAIQTLDDLHRRYSDASWVQVEALRGDTERALGHSESAVEAWDRGWEVGSDTDRSKLRVRIATVARGMTNSELAEAHEAVKSRDVRQVIEDQIAKRAKPELNEPMPEFEGTLEPEEEAAAPAKPLAKAGKSAAKPASTKETEVAPPAVSKESTARAASKTSAAAAEAKSSAPPAAETPAAVVPSPVVQAAAPSPVAETKKEPTTVNPNQSTKYGKVAVLLPMTGLEAATGERALNAIRLVFEPKLVVIRDAQDSPAAAVRQFNELANDPDVLAVIGPIDDETTSAVAAKAFASHLPLITLSTADEETRPYVVQGGVPQQQLLRKLLDYSMGRVRLKRFGIVYPDDASGEALAASIKAQVDERGGAIVGTDAYAPEAKTLSAGMVHRWRDTQNLQALILSDGVRAANTFARFLQREMPDILLLGVNNWDLLGESNDVLSGVVFASAFYPNSGRAGAKEFVGRYEHTYGTTPGSIEAESYDAALLVRHALDAGAHSRASVWDKLQSTANLEGATGPLTVTPKGVRHEALVLQVVGGKIVELEAPVDSGPAQVLAK
ncbi:MAG: ABC transporter substrate-binding protein, partial [Deltaproteobacteria bacterium]|nr:ABC transporter substrate-binding protein [Deltaproteobacteria bacterium]